MEVILIQPFEQVVEIGIAPFQFAEFIYFFCQLSPVLGGAFLVYELREFLRFGSGVIGRLANLLEYTTTLFISPANKKRMAPCE